MQNQRFLYNIHCSSIYFIPGQTIRNICHRMIAPTNTFLLSNITICSFQYRFDMTETVILKCLSWLLQGISVDNQIHLFVQFSFHSRFPEIAASTKVRNGLYFGSLFRGDIPLRSISSIPLCPGALSKTQNPSASSIRQG